MIVECEKLLKNEMTFAKALKFEVFYFVLKENFLPKNPKHVPRDVSAENPLLGLTQSEYNAFK